MHRNQDCFGSDAEEYNPERWLAEPDAVQRMERYLIPVTCSQSNSLVLLSMLILYVVWSWLQCLSWETCCEHRALQDYCDADPRLRLPPRKSEGGVEVSPALCDFTKQLASVHQETEIISK